MTFDQLEIQDRRDRFVAVLRQLVAKSGYTHRTLAEALGISKSQVGLTLVGERRVEFVRLMDWLRVLETPVEDFLKLLDSAPGPE